MSLDRSPGIGAGLACDPAEAEQNPRTAGLRGDVTRGAQPTHPLTALSLEQFLAGTPVPEWVPWLYGSPLADHIRACQEIGGPRPRPRKKSPPAAGGESTTGAGTPY